MRDGRTRLTMDEVVQIVRYGVRFERNHGSLPTYDEVVSFVRRLRDRRRKKLVPSLRKKGSS